ncbi:cytidyltransferase [Cyanophage S-RIM50]|jgi:hypothetical protein|uniref:Uncharacterized protein n=1 Tax=Cyanophage S-RIM50 TaxID=687803 RepID=A0A127KLY9_9CAUD|nr:cytidyltransferase [Cyanophage S-RIM50]AMO42969.1 hypothetical protein R290704_187 [Cyanophage S-RIM50]
MNLNDLPDMSDALKQVQMYEAKKKGDGNLANNAVPYDKVTKADIIVGAVGRDEKGGKAKPKGHDCAKLVKYAPDGGVKEEFETIPEQHTLLEDGTVTHYDITDGEWIYENVPVEELEIVISEKHEHFVNYDKNAEVLGEDAKYDRNRKRAAQRAAARNAARDAGQTGAVPGVGYVTPRREKETYVDSAGVTRHKSGAKNEAFAFSDAEWEELAMLGEEIDAMTDEELIDFMEEIILEVAEDDQDLIEICEALEEVEVISERVDPKETQRRRDQAKDRLETGSAMKSAAEKSSAPSGPSRVERMKSAAKSAAKKVGSAVKAGAKMAGRAASKAGKAAVSTAGKVAGTYQGEKEAARIKAKRTSMEKTPPKKKETSSDDDGTDGKLDALLKSTRGTSSSSDSGSKSGGGGESSSSSGSSGPGILKSKSSEKGSTRKAVGGALKSAAKLVGKGIKKAVGKTARAVSSGSDKLAKRLGEEYEQIAHLYESGLFSIEEIENVIEEGYKEIDRDKENRMYRRAGNLARTSLSSTGRAKKIAQDKSAKIVSAITSKKERERFDRIGQDPKHQNNYGG